MIHALNEDGPPSVIDHGNDAGPMIARCLHFGSGHHFTRCGQGDDFLLGKLRRRTPGSEGHKSERETEHQNFGITFSY